VVFEADYDKIKLQNAPVVMTSSPSCHQKNVTEFFQFRLLPNKISDYAIVLG